MSAYRIEPAAFDISLIDGVRVELRFVLRPEWVLSTEGDTFVVTAPRCDDWEDEIWRILRFIAYDHFFAVSRRTLASGVHEIDVVSAMPSLRGFRILFRLTPT
jgi:hypothetical protein